MALGDGIRRNIAHVDPAERAMLRDAFKELNHRFFPGSRNDSPAPGGVTWWFKQDEIHQATHVHGGPEFVPWHREICNRLEDMLRAINPLLSLHYWDWTQDPTDIPNANLGGGTTGNLNLFTDDFFGYGGNASDEIGEPWKSAGFYDPNAALDRDSTGNAADPPLVVNRFINHGIGPTDPNDDAGVVNANDYADMRNNLEAIHDNMHGFVAMGGQHISFRDPFVFLLHSNVDRLFARWQTDPAHSERLEPSTVYGSESGDAGLNSNVEPWSTGFSLGAFTRPFSAPESLGVPHTYKDETIVFPPCYDTNQGQEPLVEVLNAGTPPVIHFNDVPEGETAMRAAVLRVYTCAPATIRVKPGDEPTAPFSTLWPVSGVVPVTPGPTRYFDARIWFAYTAGAANVPVPDGSVTIQCVENGQEFAFVLKANAIERESVAVVMALDQSGSMGWDAGTSGAKRIQVLKEAAELFVDLVQADNGVGLIRFDHDSYAVNDATWPGFPVTRINTDSDIDPDRLQALDAVKNHAVNPAGNTSVGDGVDRARDLLDAIPDGEYTHKAMIVMTDGLENEPLWLDDVSGSIDDRTFAVGLGNEQQVDTVALRKLAQQTGGFLYLSGLLSASMDDYFRMRKFFLQILAGVTNNDIIIDPNGYVSPGMTVRIPYRLNEADITCAAVLMTDYNVVEMMLEAPNGSTITSAAAPGLGMVYGTGSQSRRYRYTMPVPIGSGQHAGLWHVVLKIDDQAFKRQVTVMREKKDKNFSSFATHGARYCVAVQTFSNLRMRCSIEQSGFEPGAKLTINARLSEYGVPVEYRAAADVELTRPGGSKVILKMTEIEPGTLSVTTTAAASGVYHARVLARGTTLRGNPFTREQILTGAVWTGGNQPHRPPRDSDDKRQLCALLACLLSEKNLSREYEESLRKRGINLDGLRQCLARFCRGRQTKRGR
jgi:hypothetical protein